MHPNILAHVPQKEDAPSLLKQVKILPFTHDYLLIKAMTEKNMEGLPPLIAVFSNGQAGLVSPLTNETVYLNKYLMTKGSRKFVPI